MLFDGAEIRPGDDVFDVAYGPGKVTQVREHEQRFVVVFNEKQYTYQLNGAGNFKDRKTLFWRNPIGQFIPMKDDAHWEKFLKVQTIFAEVFGGR